MRFLLASTCLIFSGIFFLFSKSLFSSDGFMSSQILSGVFLFLSIFFFVYFSSSQKVFIDEEPEKESFFQKQNLQMFFSQFFQKYLYYIAFFILYLSFFFLLSSFGATQEVFYYGFFVINLLLIVLFFITEKFFILRDILRVNTVLLSLVFIFQYFFSTVLGYYDFDIVRFINSLLLYFLLGILLVFQSPNKKNIQSDPVIVGYVSIYTLLWFTYYGGFIFTSSSLSFHFFTTILGICLFFLPGFHSFFGNAVFSLRTIGIIFSGIGILTGITFGFIDEITLFSLLLLLVGTIFQYFVHKSYENYVSFFLSFLAVSFIVYKIYFLLFHSIFGDYTIFYTNFTLFSFLIVAYTFIFKGKYIYDTLSLCLFATFVNLYTLGVFLFFGELEIFKIGIILLVESVFLFMVYYRINTFQKGLQ